MRTLLRTSTLTAVCCTVTTGAVMASSTACRVAAVEQFRAAQDTVHKRVHHSAATLARWKIGAAAWSKAHGGKVYAGVPASRRSDWTPLQFTCDDVALDGSRPDQGMLLASETLPEFADYGGPTPVEVASGLAAATPQGEEIWARPEAGPMLSALSGGGAASGPAGGINGPAGQTSFAPAPVPPSLAGPVPAPESPTIVLLGMGMLSFLVTRLRRKTVV